MQAFIKTAATIYKNIQDGIVDVSNEVSFFSFYLLCPAGHGTSFLRMTKVPSVEFHPVDAAYMLLYIEKLVFVVVCSYTKIDLGILDTVSSNKFIKVKGCMRIFL